MTDDRLRGDDFAIICYLLPRSSLGLILAKGSDEITDDRLRGDDFALSFVICYLSFHSSLRLE
jgi:hypothetical protein